MDYNMKEIKDHNSIGYANRIVFLNPSVTKVIRDFFLFRVTLKKFSLPWKRSSPEKEIINPDQEQSLSRQARANLSPKKHKIRRAGQILRYHSFRQTE